MNEALIVNHNNVVNPDDMVYHLGDFSMAWRPVELYLKRLNGYKPLVYGNHDFCSHLHKKGKKDLDGWKQKYLEAGFSSVQDRLALSFYGQAVLLHHFPYKTIEDPNNTYKVRYLDERQEDRGFPLLHGHTHARWVTKGNCIDVGVDAHNYTPVSEKQILELIKTLDCRRAK